MIDDTLMERLQATLPSLSRLGAVVRFDLGADGAPVLDARDGRASFAPESDADADCTIRINQDNLVKLLDGKLDPMLGYAMGKIKVTGSLGVAMKLIGALG